MKGSSVLLRSICRNIAAGKLSCSTQPCNLDHKPSRLNQQGQSSSRCQRALAWRLGLLIVALGSLGIAGCGTFVGTPNNAAAAGLLIALPNNVDFGSVPVGQTATATVSLINKSADPIEISQLTFTGQSFSILAPGSLPITIAAGSTLKMTVQFGPTTSGAAQGDLNITSNLSPSPAAVVSLKGKGTANGGGSAGGSPTLSINATAISFGDVTLGTTSTQTVTLTSTGTTSLTINSATITGAGFSVSGATFPVSLKSGQSLSLNVQFDPTVAGTASGQLTISSNSSTNATDVVSLSGNGVASSSGTSYQVNLSWNAPVNSTDPVAGYNIYRAPSGTSTYQLVNSAQVALTQYSDQSVQSGASYDYIVRSVDASGVESTASNMANVAVP